MPNEIESRTTFDTPSVSYPSVLKKETELKKAWNLIVDYCGDRGSCRGCLFHRNCDDTISTNRKIEVSNEP